MRDIRFRAWDKKSKTMTGDCYIGELPMMTLNEFFTDENAIFLQFTGLKDKNGKDVYEGDIVQRYEGAEFCRVVWYEYGWCFQEGSSKDIYKNEPYPILKAEKVIGNIYENPELLK